MIFISLILGAAIFVRHIPYFNGLILVLGVVFMMCSPVTVYAYRYFFPNKHHALLDLEADFVRPVVQDRPDVQKNIIYIYLESIERTYRDIPETANAFAPLSELEDRGLSFSQVSQVYGVHFTAGGLVGTLCGAPLLPNGMRSLHKKTTKDADSDVLQFDGIMNDVTCLGDILSEDGYIGSYLNGSDLDIFSKGEIFQSHGWDRVFGANSIPGPRSDVYENVWGLNDDTLFDYAQAELEFLAGTGKPFM
ncbi:MAG: sulfatase-like hydrolase/transferase, partial [Mangrovicoccus sp.]